MAWRDTYAAQIGFWSPDYVPPAVVAEMRGSHLLGLFFRLATDPALHIWCGVHDVPAGFDSIDPLTGVEYIGGGRLLNVPTLEVLVNGQSGSVEFGISGIEPATAQRAIEAIPDVRGEAVHVGITTLDQYYQPMSRIIALWNGMASHPTERVAPVSGTDQPTVDLSLAVVTGNNTRSRAALSLWSPAHQKALYPTDLYCDGTARLARGVAPPWPNYTGD